MYSVLAAELMIWSTACMAKFQVMNSTIGFRPANAAPTPMPAKPCSVIGVSMMRFGPNSSSRPWLIFVRALILRDFLAHQQHVAVAAHLLGHGIAQRFAHGLRDELAGARRQPRFRTRGDGRRHELEQRSQSVPAAA